LELEADEDNPDSTLIGKALNEQRKLPTTPSAMSSRPLSGGSCGWYLQQIGTN
jgi:hypothetical protein